MKKCIAFIMAGIILVLPVLCFGEQSNEQDLDINDETSSYAAYIRKDPILAAALSWYIPGLGQLYSGAYLKGILFWVVENSLLIAALMPFAELKLDVTGNVGIGVDLKSRDNILESNTGRVSLALGIALAAVHLINVIDAVDTTRQYNRVYDEKLYTNFGYDIDSREVIFGIGGRF
ncbi:MAG: hypothetical protein JSV25_07345 [Spirochaetota bacterium]|nr:MAG: hypothetical protein JSV25_07345 [Spirochaetota bacterium]